MLRRKNVGAPSAGQGEGGSRLDRPIGNRDGRKIEREAGPVQSLSLEDLKGIFGGEILGHDLVCPGPGHSEHDKSLSVTITVDGDIVTHSYAGDPQTECNDYVIDAILSAFCSNPPTTWWERRDLVREMLGGPRSGVSERPQGERTPAQVRDDQRKKQEKAISIFGSGQDPRGTPVELWFQKRCIGLPPRDDIKEVIRFDPNCRFGLSFGPAMVCLVRDAVTDEPLGIHRTAITWKGEKATHMVFDAPTTRANLGPVKTDGNIGAIKLFPGPAIHDGQMTLGVGEGIETALSLWKIHGIPVWSMLDGGNLAKLPPLRGIEKLVVAKDNDDSGKAAVQSLVRRWAPIDVFSVEAPYPLNDLNDVLWQRPMARGTGL